MDHATSPSSDDHQGPAAPEPDLEMGYLDATEEWNVQLPSEAQKAGSSLDSLGDRAERQDGSGDRTQSIQGDVASERLIGARTGRASDAIVAEERHGRAAVRGFARSVELRRIQDENVDVLTFRVDRYDPDGNRLQPVGVEVYAYRGGQISYGEEVSISGRWHDGTLRAEKVVNVTTGAQIKGTTGWMAWAGVAVFLLFVAFLVILGVLTS